MPKNKQAKNKVVGEGSDEGIQLRKGKTAESIRILFRYQGKLCRETLPLEHTERNIKVARNRRHAILHDISNNEFKYEEHFPNSATVRKINEQREAELRKEEEAQKKSIPALGEYLDEYLKLGLRRWKNSSKNEYEQVVGQLKKIWGENKPLPDLTVKVIRNWIMGLGVGKSRINNLTSPLKGALRLAAIDEVIEYNPFDLINISELIPKKDDDDEDDGIVDPFSVDEIEAILAACRHQERDMFQFAFGTGMRPCEYINAKWSWINPDKSQIKVAGNYVDGIEQRKGKTAKSNRNVHLRKMAFEALQNQYDHKSDELIFLDARYNERWDGDRAIRARWGRILKAAGVRYRNPYQTRHTYASSLLMLGANILYVAHQLGHEDTTMVTRHYSAWIEGGLDGDKRARLQALYSQIDPKRRNEFPVFDVSD
jgi:integrase